jgi:hypothetical protein
MELAHDKVGEIIVSMNTPDLKIPEVGGEGVQIDLFGTKAVQIELSDQKDL